MTFRLPVKTNLEEKFEEVIKNFETYEIKWFGDDILSASYFKNFEILDTISNKKYILKENYIKLKLLIESTLSIGVLYFLLV